MRDLIGTLLSWVWPALICAVLVVAAMFTRSCEVVRADKDNRDFLAVLGDRRETKSITVDPTVPLSALRTGDMIAYQHPSEGGEITFARVTATPGQTLAVVVTADGLRLQVDGEIVNQKLPLRTVPFAALTIPTDHVWVTSDGNRYDSLASGPVPAAVIRGRAKE